MMADRRTLLTLAVGLALTGGVMGHAPAHAQPTDRASGFVKTAGEQLVAIVNGPGSPQDKRRELGKIIQASVDMDAVGRFCLGRYWRQTTPEQQQSYLTAFREVIINNIAGKLGEYQGVRFMLGRSRSQEEDQLVSTTIEQPNKPPVTVDWVIAHPNTDPKIVDVIAEGASLRLTQRNDYAAYLQRNGGDISALIVAIRQQVARES